jgi:hypothetical protein
VRSSSRRVYTILAALLVALVATASSRAQIDLTIEPVMVKGPAGAPVTIIEFSDYQ